MIVGHQRQFQFLRYMAQTGQLPHALLFSGEERLGKKTVALELAKMLHCESTDMDSVPCQRCPSCRAITKGIYADLLLVEPQNKQIKIAQVRDVSNFLSLSAAAGRHKVAIINNAHLMTVSAQQAFLKTLEEPRGNVVILLVTSKPYTLLPTIISRVQQIKFFPVSTQELIDFLREKGVPYEDYQDIIKLSARRPGAVLEFLSDKKSIRQQMKTLKDIQALCGSALHERFEWAQNMAKNPQGISEILELWLRFFRGLLIMKLRSGSKIRAFPDYSLNHLQRIIGFLQEVDFAISNSNVSPRSALDVLMLEL